MNLINQDPRYKSFRQFNKAPLGDLASSRTAICTVIAERHFRSDSLQDRLVGELGRRRALPFKEILESFEFFERVRKHIRASCVTDLCCGRGLTGILFALFERCVERVVLIDRSRPPSHAHILAAAVEVGPWVAGKVRFETASMKEVAPLLAPSTSIIATHACSALTDRCIDRALELNAPVGLMPCCYPNRGCTAPHAIQLTLGTGLAFDIDRTYRLQNAGYRVRWDAIPREITPMNRVLIGKPTTD